MPARAKVAVWSLRPGKSTLTWLVLLSFFDAFATDMGIRMRAISEANPFAAYLYETDPIVFYAYKIMLPLLLFFLIQNVSEKSFIKKWILIVTLVYALLAIYHLVWILLVFLL
ncbi:DUF5658 family protein [Paenibacillus sp. CF384]|uniref:DUF5658 family protein n=1 Tax=Paenibacillus sp. CF384 TaxID=1884382 RepID=UPI000896B370|nr:DUF5658 family protein [Paenibacillus sp. CF384]SDX57182.1 hypothetical protein SAMN05518855_1016136 [Paenibacillus sp. CF384]